MNKVLFILKRKDNYNEAVDQHIGLTTGLYNSASFMNNMLNEVRVPSEIVVVTDNNDIDREVTKHKPTHVVIEALWVVPTKFEILQKLHPTVKWIVRLHSEVPFIAGEGVAMDWICEYLKFSNVYVAANSKFMLDDITDYARYAGVDHNKVIYLPNYYPENFKHKKLDKSKEYIDIGCFGAVRPMKNHLIQAFAAVRFAEEIGKKLRFHVNAGRVEMNGQPSQRNLMDYFIHINKSGHELINHSWSPHEEFLELCSSVDIGMQCNFSETFNIVGADLISQGVPLIGSSEIPWQLIGKCDPTSTQSIINTLHNAYSYPWLNVKLNQWSLRKYINDTQKIWHNYFGD